MPKDPVCGMEVEEDKSAAVSVYKGKAYYFCSLHCKNSFDKDPEKYLGAAEPLEPMSSDGRGAAGSRAEGAGDRIDLPVLGMSCASCAANIQRSLSALAGVKEVNVNFATAKATPGSS